MSGKTAFQKIVDSHCRKVLPDGRMVLQLDWVWCHEITTPNAILDAKIRDCDVVFDPNKIKTMIDHVNPAKDTASAIQSGIVFGYASLVDGILQRMFEELGARPKVIATGGLARVISSEAKLVDEIEDDLTMEGLRILYRRNRPART